MKKFFIFIVVITFGVSCNEKGRQFSVSSSASGPIYSGDTLQFDFVSEKKRIPDSVVVRFNAKEIFQTVYHTNVYSLKTDGLSMGDKTITFEIYRKGHSEVHNRTLRILSDLEPTQLSYQVVASYPHDKKSYTQGLQWEQGRFYESAGLYGQSSLRYVDVRTGRVLRSDVVDDHYFAEGIALVGDSLYMLTWREKTGFIYNKNTFEKIQSFSYETEGWGLCYDGTNLIMSDGTEYLYFYNPKNFSLIKKIAVFDNLGAVSMLNELEYVNGFVYANVYQTDKIVKINPGNGKVAAEIDFSHILPTTYVPEVDVLNGIAWNPETDRFYITGKLWPFIYEVRLFYNEL